MTITSPTAQPLSFQRKPNPLSFPSPSPSYIPFHHHPTLHSLPHPHLATSIERLLSMLERITTKNQEPNSTAPHRTAPPAAQHPIPFFPHKTFRSQTTPTNEQSHTPSPTCLPSHGHIPNPSPRARVPFPTPKPENTLPSDRSGLRR